MSKDKFDKFLDRLPVFDGSGRRRLVAGGIVLIWLTIFYRNHIGESLSQFKTEEFLSSPLITGGAFLLVYAIGSVIDIFGDVFFIRAASGVFWGLNCPTKMIDRYNLYLKKFPANIACYLLVIPCAFYGMFLGFIGRTKYTINTSELLSLEARSIYDTFPEKIKEGLKEPVGDSAEYALKYIIDEIEIESDRNWARSIIGRSKDVGAITTALVVIILFTLLSGKLINGNLMNSETKEVQNISQHIEGLSPLNNRYMVNLDKIESLMGLGKIVPQRHIDSIKGKIEELKNLKVANSNRTDFKELLGLGERVEKVSKKIESINEIKTAFINVSNDKIAPNTIAEIISSMRINLDKNEDDINRIKNEIADFNKLNTNSTIVTYAQRLKTNNLREKLENNRLLTEHIDELDEINNELKRIVVEVMRFESSHPQIYHEIDLQYVKIQIEIEETISKEWFDAFKIKLAGSFFLQKLNLLEEFAEKLPDYNKNLQENRRLITRRYVIFVLTTLPLFLLYLGFFVSLRNAILSILEALTHKGKSELKQNSIQSIDAP